MDLPDNPAPQDSLVERARHGDAPALEALLERNKERLEGLAHARLGEALGQKVRSSDILQSTYLRVVKSIDRFTGATEDDFANWIVRVLENTLRDRARYHNAEKRDRGRDVGRDIHELNPASRTPTPSAQAGFAEELLLISRAMQRMPANYARMLTLHLEGTVSHRETAEIFECTENASRVLLARARARLLVELERERRS